MKPTFLKLRQLGRLDLAVDLRQRLLAAHRQDRMAERDHDADRADQAEPIGRMPQRLGERWKFAQPTERILLLARDGIDPRHNFAVGEHFDLLAQVGLPGGNFIHRPANGERRRTPDEHDHGHHGRGDHDLERFAARLVDAEQILPQEVQRDRDRRSPRSPRT